VPGPLRVERRVSRRGALVVAKQRIHVGIAYAGRTLTVEAAESTWRVYDQDGLLVEVARTTTKPIARFKVHKPELPRRSIVSAANPVPLENGAVTNGTPAPERKRQSIELSQPVRCSVRRGRSRTR
jgi:hypothetical protein